MNFILIESFSCANYRLHTIRSLTYITKPKHWLINKPGLSQII